MKKLFAVLILSVASIAAVSTADAAAGCGIGWHRDFWGHCRRNAAVVVAAPGVAVGVAAPGVAVGVAPGAAVVVGRACPYHHHLDRWGHCVHNW
jgi:hypothetical protein